MILFFFCFFEFCKERKGKYRIIIVYGDAILFGRRLMDDREASRIKPVACFTRNGDDESFGRGSGRVSSLDISTQSGERFPRRIPRANLSETGPKKRDIYREDLKYKVDRDRDTLSRVPIFREIPNSNRASLPFVSRNSTRPLFDTFLSIQFFFLLPLFSEFPVLSPNVR